MRYILNVKIIRVDVFSIIIESINKCLYLQISSF